MKVIEVKLGIPSDKDNQSKVTIVFDEDKASEVFNALGRMEDKVKETLKQRGIITEEGYGVAEYAEYLDTLNSAIGGIDKRLDTLYRLKETAKASPIDKANILLPLLDKEIDELWVLADSYFTMFEGDIDSSV